MFPFAVLVLGYVRATKTMQPSLGVTFRHNDCDPFVRFTWFVTGFPEFSSQPLVLPVDGASVRIDMNYHRGALDPSADAAPLFLDLDGVLLTNKLFP
jgi:hypothetical protein